MTETYLALLRAINLGPNNKILMSDLVKVFVGVGCNNVRTYIQSGNVIFEAAPELSQQLPDLIRTEIERRFCLQVPTILRTAREMRGVVNRNPFLKEGVEGDGAACPLSGGSTKGRCGPGPGPESLATQPVRCSWERNLFALPPRFRAEQAE